jgi:uncharacterized protein
VAAPPCAFDVAIIERGGFAAIPRSIDSCFELPKQVTLRVRDFADPSTSERRVCGHGASAQPERLRGAVVHGTLHNENGTVVCERCAVARRPLARMRGLLGRRGLDEGEGLLLQPAGSVHTFFMRFPIDVVFLDGERRVLRVVSDVRPWRTAAAKKARAVLELAAGEAARVGMTPGSVLRLEVSDERA